MRQPDFDATVLELVTEFGGPAIYTKTTLGPYNPATGLSTPTVFNIPITLAIFDLNRPNNGVGTKLGSEIQQGDKEVYIVPPAKQGQTDIMPIDTVNDNILLNGLTYSIVTAKEINPSGTDTLMYVLYLRR